MFTVNKVFIELFSVDDNGDELPLEAAFNQVPRVPPFLAFW